MTLDYSRFATRETASLRERLDAAGIAWSTGVFPNVETCARVVEPITHELASATVLELEDGRFSILYAIERLTEGEVVSALENGVKFGKAVGYGWSKKNKDE